MQLRQLPGPAPIWHRWMWDGHSSRSEEAYIPTEYFSKLFLVQNECREDMGWGVVEAGPATLPNPQIMAMLSGAQLR